MAPHATQAVRARRRDDQLEADLRAVLEHARGGANRRRLLQALGERPRNTNQLAKAVALDYKTVQYHLGVLRAAGAVSRSSGGYGAVYVPTANVRRHWELVAAPSDTPEE